MTRYNQYIQTSYGPVEVVNSGVIHHHFPRHFHETFPFGVVEEGTLGFHYRGEKITAHIGTINLANPGEVHDGFPRSQAGWQYRMFYVDCNLLREIMGQNHNAATFPWFPMGVIKNDMLAKQIMRLHQAVQAGTLSQLALETRLFIILDAMISQYAQLRPLKSAPESLPHTMPAVCELLRESCHLPLTLKTLADFCGLSGGYFIRAFRSYSGMTPHQYQLVCRTQRARSQIMQGLSIGHIAHDNGFVDQSHFSHVFKQYYGYPPGACLHPHG
jgi:AraC-like DNA-binding protein